MYQFVEPDKEDILVWSHWFVPVVPLVVFGAMYQIRHFELSIGIGTPFGGGGIVNERYCQVPEPTVVNGAWYVFEVALSVNLQQISEGPDQFDLNQSENVAGEPNGVPQLKSAVMRPSIFC